MRLRSIGAEITPDAFRQSPGEGDSLAWLRMPRRTQRQRDLDSATYGRCFLFSLGALFLGLVLWLSPFDSAPEWAELLALAFAMLGQLLIGVSLLAPSRRVEDWADQAATHEAALFVMLLAYPLYRLIKLVRRSR